MQSKYNIPLSELIREFQLEKVYLPEGGEDIKVSSPEVSRPGLAMSGFLEVFEPFRIQIVGKAEHKYLHELSSTQRNIRLEKFFKMKPVALVVTSKLSVFDEMEKYAREYGVPILRTNERTSSFMASLIAFLNTSLAPRITRHGVLVEVYGEGVLILGDSGIGKSETAIELVKRGHRLIADDAVEIRRVSDSLYGTAPELIRHYIEIRGIGVIDVQQLFGMGAVQFDSDIEIVIHLEPWQDGKFYDRLGLEGDTYNLLGVHLPYVTIPVRPGRNLAGIVEIAAMKNRQMRYGYNSARDFMTQFDRKMDELARQAKEQQ